MAVLGFAFPMCTEQDIESLETAVKHSGVIREQYVKCFTLNSSSTADELCFQSGSLPKHHKTDSFEYCAIVQYVLHRSLDDQLQLLWCRTSGISQEPEESYEEIRHIL